MPNSASLTHKKCTPCEGGMKPFTLTQAQELVKNIPGWNLDSKGHNLSHEYVMKNFMAAVKFINSVAKLAEEENHHPDIHLTSYKNLRIDLSTHKIGGLSENDFILAAKINDLPVELKK